MTRPWLRRCRAGLAAGVVLLACSRAGPPSAASRVARPSAALEAGMRVDVGGYRLFVRCRGQGGPVVVFDAGGNDDSSAWRAVEPPVAARAQACVYDRANHGQSDAGPYPTTSGRVVDDLHTLLAAVQRPGPYVLVGHSFGGLNMQLYARRYPAETAGLVLVDSAHEDSYSDPALTTCAVQLCGGVDYAESARQVRAAPPLPDVPVRVLAHGRPAGPASPALEERWPAWQQDLAARAPRGRLVVAEQSGHEIPLDQPDLVVTAIQEVIEQGRR